MPESYLITGATRGIGLAFVEEILSLEPDSFVIATGRDPKASKGLQELSEKYKERLALVKLDVSDAKSVQQAAEQVTPLLPNGLDYLVLNAGVHHQPACTFDNIDFNLLQDELRFNTEYPIVVTRTFLPLVRKGTAKKIVFVTSELGSIDKAQNLPGLTNAYSIAKAALNMVGRKYGTILKMEGINVIMLHPGWVETDIGDGIGEWMSKYAPQMKKMTTKESAASSLKVIFEAKLEDATAFYINTGKRMAW